MAAIFNRAIFNRAIFNTAPVIDTHDGFDDAEFKKREAQRMAEQLDAKRRLRSMLEELVYGKKIEDDPIDLPEIERIAQASTDDLKEWIEKARAARADKAIEEDDEEILMMVGA